MRGRLARMLPTLLLPRTIAPGSSAVSGSPTTKRSGVGAGKGVTPQRPTTRYGTGKPSFLYVHACGAAEPECFLRGLLARPRSTKATKATSGSCSLPRSMRKAAPHTGLAHMADTGLQPRPPASCAGTSGANNDQGTAAQRRARLQAGHVDEIPQGVQLAHREHRHQRRALLHRQPHKACTRTRARLGQGAREVCRAPPGRVAVSHAHAAAAGAHGLPPGIPCLAPPMASLPAGRGEPPLWRA